MVGKAWNECTGGLNRSTHNPEGCPKKKEERERLVKGISGQLGCDLQRWMVLEGSVKEVTLFTETCSTTWE